MRIRRLRRPPLQNLKACGSFEMANLDTEQKPSRRLWIWAAVAALVLHVGGGALAVAHLKGSDNDEYLGAQGDIGIELTSATAEDTDLPAGPDADASVASPALPDQKAEVKETDLPKDTPTETEDPDRVVTTTDSAKPKEDDPKVAAVQTQASEESVAQEATARQSIEGAKVDDHPTVINQGIGKDAQKLIAKWRGQLSAYLNLHKRYPEVRNTKAAKVKVGFVLDRRGHVVSMRVIEGSGDSAYDEAALEMIRRSDPVPQPPPMEADEGLNFTLDVIFPKGKS
jgi:protein TonB